MLLSLRNKALNPRRMMTFLLGRRSVLRRMMLATMGSKSDTSFRELVLTLSHKNVENKP